ncbi:MAG: AraC family transcriptional regulator [Proteobacteria bacterium]|nr:AraC family transcriptional regulator [Pseudomonadota bacterium]
MTVYAPTTDYIWELIRSRGMDPAPLFTKAGLDPEIRNNPNKRVSRKQFDHLLDIAAEASGDSAFGLRATAHFHPSHFGALGYSWLTSSSLSSALRKFLRYSRVVTDTHFMKVREEGADVIIDYTRPPGVNPPAHHLQVPMALFVHLCRLILGDDFSPDRVEFTAEQPLDIEPFVNHFRCPLQFNAATDCIVIPTRLMDKKLSRGHPELSRMHNEVITRYLALHDKTDIISQSRAAIIDLMAEGDISAETVAAMLNISVRTLGRRLDEEHLSFRELLSEQRHELALKYIRDESLTLTEISYLLGFSEPSSFSRAYRGWTGMSPSKARNPADAIPA